MVEIPSCFDHPGAAFVTLPAGIKFPPPYKGWQDPKNWRSYKRACKHGGNVGIVAGNGYIGLDKDNPEAFEGLELPATTTWETRPGRLGLRFKISDDLAQALASIGKKADLAQLYLFKDGKQCGEVKLQRAYQVIPPSWKKLEDGTRADYKMVDSSPPAEISLAKLLADLQAIGITFSSKLEKNTAKLENNAKEARQKAVVSDEARTRRYAEAALHKEAQAVAGAPEGNRNKQLNDSVFALAQFVAAGALDEGEVILELTKAAEKTGLGSEEITKTIRSGLDAGKQHPREIPPPPQIRNAPEASSALFAGYPIKDLTDAIKAKGEAALDDPKILDAMAEIQKADPMAFEFFCLVLGKKTKIPKSTVTSSLNAHTAMGNTSLKNAAPCDIHELISAFKKWLYIMEDYNITGPFAGIVANFCEGSPDIIGIIGPSGSTKTEFIRALGETQNQYVYPISTITEHTLVSGHKDSNDLVPLLKGRLLTIKDLTSILARKEDVRAAIFADFRELTDEYIRKEFGNGIAKEYHDIHSSILFASTNAIERYYSMYSNLGQRMIFIRPKNDPKEARKKAAENRGKQKEMRAELHEVTMRFIASIIQAKKEKSLPTTPDDIQEEMGVLYDFLALARTTIHHDYKSGDIDELPEPEFPTRIANTVGRLMEVHALFYSRDEVNDEDVAFGCRILTDNIPTTRWRILNALTKEWQHTSKISQLADLPTRSVKYHLDELVALKLVEKLLKDEQEDWMDHRFEYFKLSDLASDAIEIYNTRIRIKGTIEEGQSKIIDKQNILLTNPCVISPHLEGEGGTLEESREEPTLGKLDRPTPVKCAKCGEDLTGKGTFKKGGKVYCPKPGCGYDAREGA